MATDPDRLPRSAALLPSRRRRGLGTLLPSAGLVALVTLAPAAPAAAASTTTPSAILVEAVARDGRAGALGLVVGCVQGTVTSGTTTASAAVADAVNVEIGADGRGRAVVPTTPGSDCVIGVAVGAGWTLADADGGQVVRDAGGAPAGLRVQPGSGTTTVELGVVGPVATGTGALIVERTSRDADFARMGAGTGLVLVGVALAGGIVRRRRRLALDPVRVVAAASASDPRVLGETLADHRV